MELRKLFADDQAVSPVIGVILMVAITVILAAVIGTFVLGLGDQVSSSAPQVSFTFEGEAGQSVTITHDGGDKITNDLDIKWASTTETWSASSSSAITAGDSYTTSGTVSSGDTVRVIWQDPNGGDSNTLGKFEVA